MKLRVVPSDRILRAGQTQPLAVLAEYSNGTTRDVTRQSEFASNLDVVANVDGDGFVKAGLLSGEAAIMARHMGFVAVFLAIVPHGQPPPYFASATPTTGEKDPLTGKVPEPKYLDGIAPKFRSEDDPRHALVDWMAKPENPFFVKGV